MADHGQNQKRDGNMPEDKELDSAFSDLPGINIEEGLKRLRGNQNIYKKVLLGFYESHKSNVDDINII